MNPSFENKLRGTYCQFIDGKQIRFLEIHGCIYDLDKKEQKNIFEYV